jgi:transposase-like protein
MNEFEENQMVYDILIDGEGDQWRVDRLMRTYLRIDHEQKHRIKALKDHEGCLNVYLTTRNLEICVEVQRAWKEENESMIVFYSCMEKFCEVA